MNALLPPPTAAGYGRSPTPSGVRGSSNAGVVGPKAIGGLLGYWSAPAGLTSDGQTGLSRTCKGWGASPGFPGSSLAPVSGTTSRLYRSRLAKGRQVLHPNSTRYEALISGQTRNSTIAMLVRTRRVWSANVPNVPDARWFFSFATPDTQNPGLWFVQDTNGGVSGYKYVWFDISNKYASGTVNTAFSALPVGWTFLAVTIDIAGRITVFENGRKLSLVGTTAARKFTTVSIGRGTSSNPVELEIAEFAVWQSVATDQQLADLGNTWRGRWGASREPVTSVTVTGDSIIAGETYLVSTSAAFENLSICERLYLRDRRLRIYDVSKSSTLFADGVSYMTNDTVTDANAKGGLGFHAGYYPRRIHVLQHGRNDLSTGADLATMRTRGAAAVAQVKAFDSTILVGIGTVIATVFSASAAYPDQNSFDQGCIDYNADVRANFASTYGADFVIDWGAETPFAPVVGQTPYTNTTYYAGDSIHPNGQAGAELMTDVLERSVKPYAI